MQGVLSLAGGARGADAEGYRAELIRLVQEYEHVARAAGAVGSG